MALRATTGGSQERVSESQGRGAETVGMGREAGLKTGPDAKLSEEVREGSSV